MAYDGYPHQMLKLEKVLKLVHNFQKFVFKLEKYFLTRHHSSIITTWLKALLEVTKWPDLLY